MVEMRVAGIALDAATRSPIVLLRDPSGRRQVPIWIDQAQAQNIMAGLADQAPPRPLSHDLMAQLMDLADLELERVIIHAIEDSTFRAVLKLRDSAGTSHELDARPSDAIALAVRTGSGIWMLEEVVADASIAVDAEADAEDAADFRRFLDAVSPAELVRNLAKARADLEEPPLGGQPPDHGGDDAADDDGPPAGEGPDAPDAPPDNTDNPGGDPPRDSGD